MVSSTSRLSYELRRDDNGNDRGRHLISTKFIKRGELIFIERPLVALQSLTNRSYQKVLVCGCCLSFVGNGKTSLDFMTTSEDSTTTNCGSSIIPCRNNCGLVYCSKECEVDFWKNRHQFLCTGKITTQPENHPLIQFKQHAITTNEIFLLVADWIVAKASSKAAASMKNPQDQAQAIINPFDDFCNEPWWDLVDSKEEREILQNLCNESSQLWNQHIQQLLDNVDGGETATTTTPLEVAKIIGACELNSIGIRRRHPLCREILDPSNKECLRHEKKKQLLKCLHNVGMLEASGESGEDGDDNAEDDLYTNDEIAAFLANLDIQEEEEEKTGAATATTGATALNNNNSKKEEEEAEEEQEQDCSKNDDGDDNDSCCSNDGHDHDHDHDNEDTTLDDMDMIFPPLDGTAMYAITCKMNHSCEPNVVVLYKTRGYGRQHPLVANCIALKDILAGQELTISYIDTNLPLKERQQLLQHYGFICDCSKCQREKEKETEAEAEQQQAVDKVSTTTTNEVVQQYNKEQSTSQCCKPEPKTNSQDQQQQEQQQQQEDEEDYLFGSDSSDSDDDDDDDNDQQQQQQQEKEQEQKEGSGSDTPIVVEEEEEDGETALARTYQRLDTILNHATMGVIPIQILAQASSFVIQMASAAKRDILMMQQQQQQQQDDTTTTSNNTINLLEKCILAMQERDFVLMTIVGTDLENLLFTQLLQRGSWIWPGAREAYWSATVTASIGYANQCGFLCSIEFLDKAIILGLDRLRVGDFFDYVEQHASEMAYSPCPPVISPVDCMLDYNNNSNDDNNSGRGGAGGHSSSSLSSQQESIRYPMQEYLHQNSNNNSILDEVQSKYISKNKVVVIRQYAITWPAVQKWRNLAFFCRYFGHRLVPIELGSMMMKTNDDNKSGGNGNGGMKEQLMSMREFVSKYLAPSAERVHWTLDDAVVGGGGGGGLQGTPTVAYLAQHPLITQLPQLGKDIEMKPTLCGPDGPTHVYLWIGTGGTRTPLHFDSYSNIFVQLVGVKYVRIYGTEETPKLYVSKREAYGLQGNMSDIDCEREDFSQYPLAKDAVYQEVLLFPGDALFIPSRAWHYVRSLTTSVSVNFWF